MSIGCSNPLYSLGQWGYDWICLFVIYLWDKTNIFSKKHELKNEMENAMVFILNIFVANWKWKIIMDFLET